MKNNGKVCDVRSLACKIKVLNGRVPGSWKWTNNSGLISHRRCVPHDQRSLAIGVQLLIGRLLGTFVSLKSLNSHVLKNVK